jgi:hypothetical protein
MNDKSPCKIVPTLHLERERKRKTSLMFEILLIIKKEKLQRVPKLGMKI